MEHDYSTELAVAKSIARQAGALMLRYFDGDDKQTERKRDNSPVTIADKEINRLVIDELQKHFSDGIIGEEESTAEYGTGRRWICDPIDGTKGYVLGVPTAMFSLGFVVDGTALLGVTYDPFLNRMYCGMKGGGSYCNDVPLQVSQKSLAGEYVALTSSPKRVIRYEKCVAFLSEEGAELTSFSGSVYKMCMVARGSLVGYIEAGINPHDTVAAQVIVEEAGGMVTGFNGQKLDYSRPFKGALFSNGVVHQKLIQSVEDIELRPEDL